VVNIIDALMRLAKDHQLIQALATQGAPQRVLLAHPLNEGRAGCDQSSAALPSSAISIAKKFSSLHDASAGLFRA
jgi:hypothetical protein